MFLGFGTVAPGHQLAQVLTDNCMCMAYTIEDDDEEDANEDDDKDEGDGRRYFFKDEE